MVLIGGAVLVGTILGTPLQTTAQGDPAPVVRRIAATAQLAAQEYRIGVLDGRVVATTRPSRTPMRRRVVVAATRRTTGAGSPWASVNEVGGTY